MSVSQQLAFFHHTLKLVLKSFLLETTRSPICFAPVKRIQLLQIRRSRDMKRRQTRRTIQRNQDFLMPLTARSRVSFSILDASTVGFGSSLLISHWLHT